jgi:hypothetical protein
VAGADSASRAISNGPRRSLLDNERSLGFVLMYRVTGDRGCAAEHTPIRICFRVYTTLPGSESRTGPSRAESSFGRKSQAGHGRGREQGIESLAMLVLMNDGVSEV